MACALWSWHCPSVIPLVVIQVRPWDAGKHCDHRNGGDGTLPGPHHRGGQRGPALTAAGEPHVVGGGGGQGARSTENVGDHLLCLLPARTELRGLPHQLRGHIADGETAGGEKLPD